MRIRAYLVISSGGGVEIRKQPPPPQIGRMAGVLNSSITVPAMDDELRGYALHYDKFYKDGDYNEAHDSPLADALSAFIADLVSAYSDRAGSRERQQRAHAWLDQWRRDDLGWKPIYEPQKKAESPF